MGAHPKQKSVSGRSHFSQAQREQACSFYRTAFKRVRGSSPPAGLVHEAKLGCKGDPIWQAAFADFQRAQRSSEHRQITTVVQYRGVVTEWGSRFNSGAPCARMGTGIGCPLSAAEIEFAVEVLGTPVQEGENSIYFETVSQCIDRAERGPDLADLLRKKGLSTRSLHRLLVDELKVLAFTKCDVRDELPESTLRARRACADKWARRTAWLENPSPTRGGQLLKAYFKWEWYFNFTFMIDAVSFEDGVCSGGHNQRVYQAIRAKFGPQLARKKKSISATSRIMFYVMNHCHGGIVGGPWLMFSGSKVPQSLAAQKDVILAPWCVILLQNRTILLFGVVYTVGVCAGSGRRS